MALQSVLGAGATVSLSVTGGVPAHATGDTIGHGVIVSGMGTLASQHQFIVTAGRSLAETDLATGARVVTLPASIAQSLGVTVGDSVRPRHYRR